MSTTNAVIVLFFGLMNRVIIFSRVLQTYAGSESVPYHASGTSVGQGRRCPPTKMSLHNQTAYTADKNMEQTGSYAALQATLNV